MGAAKERRGKGYIECAIQQLYPLELSFCCCDVQPTPYTLHPTPYTNPETSVLRPKRNGVIAAGQRIRNMEKDHLGDWSPL